MSVSERRGWGSVRNGPPGQLSPPTSEKIKKGCPSNDNYKSISNDFKYIDDRSLNFVYCWKNLETR